jgi:hypothetical protein
VVRGESAAEAGGAAEDRQRAEALEKKRQSAAGLKKSIMSAD